MRRLVIVLLFTFCSSSTVYASVEAITLRNTHIRRYATQGAASVGTIPSGTVVELISPKSSHFEVCYGEVTGWISRSAVRVVLVDGVISANDVRYRSTPHDNTTNILGNFGKNTQVDIVAIVGDYCEIRYGDSLVYVAKNYVKSDKLHLIPYKAPPPESVRITTDSDGATFIGSGKEIAYVAMDYLGGRYIWGGNNLEVGVDCSGFVRQIYKKCGIDLSGASYDLVRYGTTVSKEDLTYGDLVFFTSGGSGIGHIGIYVSNDYFIHSQNTKTGIVMSRLTGYSGYVTAKRIIN